MEDMQNTLLIACKRSAINLALAQSQGACWSGEMKEQGGSQVVMITTIRQIYLFAHPLGTINFTVLRLYSHLLSAAAASPL